LKIHVDAKIERLEAPEAPIRSGPNRVVAAIAIVAMLVGAFLVGRWTVTSERRSATIANRAKKPLGFVKIDDTTKGSWAGIYGDDGFAIAKDTTRLPSYVRVTFPSDASIWLASARGEPRALEMGEDTLNRIASAWYGFSDLTIDVDMTDGNTHQLALYLVDWDSVARVQELEVVNSATNKALDRRAISGFTRGEYLVWNLRGHVSIRIRKIAGANAVVSGLFFD
jgi:alpha-L-rhamnosidase